MEFNIKENNKEICDQIIQKTGPLVNEAFLEIKYVLGGVVPADFGMGFVAGYLRANKCTMEESMFAAARFSEIIRSMGAESPEKNVEIKVAGLGDGNVKIESKDVK